MKKNNKKNKKSKQNKGNKEYKQSKYANKGTKYGNKDNKSEKDNKQRKGKNESLKFTCITVDGDGKGLIEVANEFVRVPYLIEGEKALVQITKKGRHTDGKVLSMVERSKNRINPPCEYFYDCGGCQIQHMNYEEQLKYKEGFVRKNMKSFGRVNEIISMDNPFNYRNKAHATFALSRERKITSGFYKEYSHEIVPIEKCIIQDEKINDIIKTVREFAKSFKFQPYDEDNGKGFLRHILVKRGFKTGQIMVVLVVADKIFPSKNKFTKALIEKHPEITTVIMNINNKNTSMILGNDERILYGKEVIEDVLCGLTFQISPKSFYQINPIQTEKLYNKAIEMADLKENEVVLDAYSGIGTISLIVSKYVKEVIGVEINKDAVKNAKMNEKLNKISNVKFYEGDAGLFMIDMAKEKIKIDTVFMDPPRSGSDEKFLFSVTSLKPKKIIYISCNPLTQVRDLKYLTGKGYKVEEIQPVDMFPQTAHVETCVKLVKR